MAREQFDSFMSVIRIWDCQHYTIIIFYDHNYSMKLPEKRTWYQILRASLQKSINWSESHDVFEYNSWQVEELFGFGNIFHYMNQDYLI